MSQTTKKFLETYKTLEQELRNIDPEDSVLSLENRVREKENDRAEKLKLCRIVRNYISHNSDGETFAGVSEKMATFLEKEVAKLNSSKDTVKKHIYKAEPLTENTTVRGAISIASVSKTCIVPVVNKGEFLGVVSVKQILQAFEKAKTPREKVLNFFLSRDITKTTKICTFAKPTDDYRFYFDQDDVVVTSDGTSKGEYVGLLKKA